MSDRFYIELAQVTSEDDLETFHQRALQAIHDNSEPHDDPITKSRYRSGIGLSYPLYGQLSQYVKPEQYNDHAFRLNFAIKHPGLYLGCVIHCVSSSEYQLEKFMSSLSFQNLIHFGAVSSDVQLEPEDSQETMFTRDRRVERRSARYKTKSTKSFDHSLPIHENQQTALTEALPRCVHINSKCRRMPAHIRQNPVDQPSSNRTAWFSIYGLSRNGSSVPLISSERTYCFSKTERRS